LVEPDGVITSIVDVRALGGRTLTFSWTHAGHDVYDQLHPTTGSVTPGGGQIYFYALSDCTLSNWFSFTLTTGVRSKTWTIPQGSKWVVAKSLTGTGDVTWRAE
jgi:hypothetical protein